MGVMLLALAPALAVTAPAEVLTSGERHGPEGVVGVVGEASRALDAASEGGADTALLAGCAGREEAARVAQAARQAIEACERARLRGEQSEGARRPESEGLALLEGRARLLGAAAASTREEQRQGAAKAAELLEPARIAAVAPEALRRVSLAGAIWLSGGVDARRDEVEELLLGVLDLPVGDDPVTSASRGVTLEALMLRALTATGAKRGEALAELQRAALVGGGGGGGGGGAGGLRARGELLAAGVAARVGIEERRPVEAALGPLMELATRNWGSGEGWAGARARQRVGGAVERAREAGLKPTGAMELIWAGEVLERAEGGPGAAGPAPASLAEGRAAEGVLRAIARGEPGQAERGGPGGGPHAEALWTLGEALERRGDQAGARVVWLELERRAPGDPRSLEGLRRAARGLAPGSVDEAPLLEALIRRLGDQPEGVRWRIDLARALGGSAAPRARGAEAPGPPRDVARAMTLLSDAAELAGRGPELIGAVDQAAQEIIAGADPRDEAALRAVVAYCERRRSPLLPEAQLTLAALLGEREADAAREEAVRLHQAVIRGAGQGGVERRARASIAAARVLVKLGRSSEGFGLLAKLANELDVGPMAPGPARSGQFWQVWAEMLAMMGADNARGERSEQIRLRIRQLETIDASLGGGEGARKIRAVEETLRR